MVALLLVVVLLLLEVAYALSHQPPGAQRQQQNQRPWEQQALPALPGPAALGQALLRRQRLLWLHQQQRDPPVQLVHC